MFVKKRLVRVCEEIVKLLQQKHLLLEYYGKPHVRVGDVEARLGFRMLRVSREAFNDTQGFYPRKMMVEISEGEQIIQILDSEMATFEQLSKEMREFINYVLGNPIWERLVQARWLKQKQGTQ